MTRRTAVAILAAATLLIVMAVNPALAARPVWTFSVALEGEQEVANGTLGAGDLDAKARAIVQIRPDAGLVCFNIGWMDIDGNVWGAHIHAAPAGVNGPIVVGFFGGPPPEDFTNFSGDRFRVLGCVEADPALLWQIVEDPSQYYVNVHSFEFPGGAVRGQLG